MQEAEKKRANELLRYAIRVSKGGCFKSPIQVRYAVLIDLAKTLKNEGFWWQYKILNYHIHNFIREHKPDLQAAKQPDQSPKGDGEVSFYDF